MNVRNTLILPIVFCVGCGFFQESEYNHPIDEHLPHDSLITNRIPIFNKIESPIPILSDLENLKFITTIGDDSDIDNEFYISSKVRIDNDNRIYIHQRHTNSIRVYDIEGEYLSSIGKSGQGPGEFNRAIAFEFSKSEDKLYILDEFGYKIEVFKAINGNYEYYKTIDHPFFRAFDLCISDQLNVSGYTYYSDASDDAYRNDKTLLQIDLNDPQVQTQYGFTYQSIYGYSNFHLIMSEFYLGCSYGSETVVAISRYFPYIIGYNSDTSKKWVSFIDGFISTIFTEYMSTQYPVPLLLPFNNLSVYNFKFPIQKIQTDTHTLLQFGWVNPQPIKRLDNSATRNNINPRFRTIVIENESGRMFHSDVYPLIAAWRNNIVITYDIFDPYQIVYNVYKVGFHE